MGDDGIPCAVNVIRRIRSRRIALALQPEQPVGTDIYPEIDNLAALGTFQPMEMVLLVRMIEYRTIRQPYQRTPVRIVDKRFAAKIQIQGDVRTFPTFRNAPFDVKPAAIEFLPPKLADTNRTIGQPLTVFVRNRFRRNRNLGLQRNPLKIDFELEPLENFGNASFMNVQIKMGHDDSLMGWKD